MKKIFLLTAVCALTALSSCMKSVEDARTYALTINVAPPTGEGSGGIGIAGIRNLKITAVNSLTGQQTDVFPEGGKAEVELRGGEYDFRAIGFADDFTVNGFGSKSLYDDGTIDVQLKVAGSNGLIFKELYMAGTKIGYGYWRDGFTEIYNNSDETLYLDGIVLGIVDYNFGNPTPWVNPDGSLMDRYPLGNFMVYFPGTGEDYPILPRESKVLATMPIDHTALPIEEGVDTPSPVDLSRADWDIFIPAEYADGDTDVIGIPNMLVAYKVFGLDFMPGMSGQPVLLAHIKDASGNILYGDAIPEWVRKPENRLDKPGGFSNHVMIPKEFVIDAVEVVYADPSKRNKLLHPEQDVGMVWYYGPGGPDTDGMYSGKSIRRKVLDFVDGNPVYQDTNNSSEDFIIGGQKPTPGIHPTEPDV